MAKVLPFEKSSSATSSEHFGWLRQVQKDSAITSSGFELAFVLLNFMNRESGYAWPTQQTLANAIGASDRTVRTLLEALITNGHIAVAHSHSRHSPNRYRIVLKGDDRKPASAQEGAKPEADFHSTVQEPETSFQSEDEKPEVDFRSNDTNAEADFHSKDDVTGNFLHVDRKSISKRPEASFRQNPPHEPPSIKHAADAVRTSDASLQADRILSAEIFSAALPDDQPIKPAAQKPEADLFRRGKEILGASAGGFIAKLLKAKGGNVALARAAIETASTAESPREYLGAIIKGRDSPDDLRTRGFAW